MRKSVIAVLVCFASAACGVVVACGVSGSDESQKDDPVGSAEQGLTCQATWAVNCEAIGFILNQSGKLGLCTEYTGTNYYGEFGSPTVYYPTSTNYYNCEQIPMNGAGCQNTGSVKCGTPTCTGTQSSQSTCPLACDVDLGVLTPGYIVTGSTTGEQCAPWYQNNDAGCVPMTTCDLP